MSRLGELNLILTAVAPSFFFVLTFNLGQNTSWRIKFAIDSRFAILCFCQRWPMIGARVYHPSYHPSQSSRHRIWVRVGDPVYNPWKSSRYGIRYAGPARVYHPSESSRHRIRVRVGSSIEIKSSSKSRGPPTGSSLRPSLIIKIQSSSNFKFAGGQSSCKSSHHPFGSTAAT